MRAWYRWLLWICPLFVFGCGGSGRGVTTRTVLNPSVTVDWPVRGRDVQGPSSALSCQFTLQPVGFTASNVVIAGDRPPGAAAVNTTYRAGSVAKAGVWNMSGNFYPLAGGFGTAVGTVSQQVRIQKDGSVTMPDNSPLNVVFTPVIASAAIGSGQLVSVGGQTPLIATAYDANGDLIVVTPGSFVFSLSGSSTNLTVATSGFATGLMLGTGSVTATIDGVSAPAQSVTVTPAFKSFALSASDVSYSATTDTLWAAIEFSQTYFSGAVVPINATSGAMGTPVAVGDDPFLVAATLDGNYVYTVGLFGTLYRVNVSTGAVDESVNLPTGTEAEQLLAVPGTPNSVALVTVSTTDGVTDTGTFIYDGITPRPNVAMVGQSVTFNSAGTRVYGFQQNQLMGGSLYTAANVDSSGITGANSQVTAIQGFGNQIQWANGKMLANDGTVIDPDSGSLLGNLTLASTPAVAAPIPSSNFAYFLGAAPSEIQEFDLGALTSPFSSPLQFTAGGVQKALYLPSNRVALLAAADFGNTLYVFRGLPK